MKKIVSFVLTAVLLLSISGAAFASQYDNCADDLMKLSLFKGSDLGAELDRAPKRVEAAVMLVRLLGKEEFALSQNSSHPYIDVADWASPYIAYLYINNITKGISEYEFGSSLLCSSQMYVTFVLRALGYSDAQGGDFSYDDALDFAHTVGIIDNYINKEPFLRAEMVAVSYIALACKPKDGAHKTLLNKLVSEGAVSTQSSAAYAEKFANFSDLSTAVMKTLDSNSFSYTYTIYNYITMSGVSVEEVVNMDISYSNENDKLQYSCIINSEDGYLEIYYKDGYTYTNDSGIKSKIPMSEAEAIETYSLFSEEDDSIYYINNLKKTNKNGTSRYSITPSESETENTLKQLIGEDYKLLPDFKLHSLIMIYELDSKGNFSLQETELHFEFTTEYNGVQTKAGTFQVVSIDITGTGSSVKVNFPGDLHSYGY